MELNEINREFTEKSNEVLVQEMKTLFETPNSKDNSKRSSSSSSSKATENKYTDFKSIEESITEDTLRFVSTQLETFGSQNDWFGVRVTVNCIKSLLQALQYMYYSSKFEDAETAKVLLQRLFFDRSLFIYELPRLFREYDVNRIPLSTTYLSDLLEAMCIVIDLMTSLSKQGKLYVLKRKHKQTDGDDVDDDDEEEKMLNEKMRKEKMKQAGEFDLEEELGSDAEEDDKKDDDDNGEEEEEGGYTKDDIEVLRQDSFLSQLIHPKTVHHLFFLFDSYSQNSINTNKFIAVIIRIIAFDFRYEHMFFRLSIIRVLEKFLHDPISNLPYFKDLKDIIEKLSQFLFNELRKDPMLFVDLLFPKTSGQWRCITHIDKTIKTPFGLGSASSSHVGNDEEEEEDDDRFNMFHSSKIKDRSINLFQEKYKREFKKKSGEEEEGGAQSSDDSDYQPSEKNLKSTPKRNDYPDDSDVTSSEDDDDNKEKEGENDEFEWVDPINELERKWSEKEEKKLEKLHRLFCDDAGVNPFVLISSMISSQVGSISEAQVAFKLFLQDKYTLEQIKSINASLFRSNQRNRSRNNGRLIIHSSPKSKNTKSPRSKIINNKSNNKKKNSKNKKSSEERGLSNGEVEIRGMLKTSSSSSAAVKSASTRRLARSPSPVVTTRRAGRLQSKRKNEEEDEFVISSSSSEEEEKMKELIQASRIRKDDEDEEVKPWISISVDVLKKQFEEEKKRLKEQKKKERAKARQKKLQKQKEEQKDKQKQRKSKSPRRRKGRKVNKPQKRSRKDFDDDNEEEEDKENDSIDINLSTDDEIDNEKSIYDSNESDFDASPKESKPKKQQLKRSPERGKRVVKKENNKKPKGLQNRNKNNSNSNQHGEIESPIHSPVKKRFKRPSEGKENNDSILDDDDDFANFSDENVTEHPQSFILEFNEPSLNLHYEPSLSLEV